MMYMRRPGPRTRGDEVMEWVDLGVVVGCGLALIVALGFFVFSPWPTGEQIVAFISMAYGP